MAILYIIMPAGKLTLVAGPSVTAKKSASISVRHSRARRSTKRSQGRMSGVRWFKDVSTVPASSNGELFNVWRPHDLTQSTGEMGDTFRKYASFWSMYRCTRVVIKLIPVGIGSESLQDQTTSRPMFKRGDVVTWVNQDDTAQGPPTSINQVIGKASSKLRNARKVIKIWAGRPSNFPIWGDIDGSFATPVFTFTDPWNSSLVCYGDNFSPSTAPGEQVFYWAFAYYKVEFKGQKH